ncbi:MAG: glycosyltransferase [Flavobacteriaceae bacterium]|nr:glycosyltransferase [Flavobacteriaceae bacterium]
MEISVVIPLFNEEESLIELHNWIVKSLKKANYTFEIIFIDDGSTDQSWDIIENLSSSHNYTYGIRLAKNYGKSQALNAGFKFAKGKFVATLDADLQDSPEEIPLMIKEIKNRNLDLISGWKKKRFDSFFLKNIPSKLFNWAARFVSGIKLNDFNCGIKVYKNKVIKTIDVRGEMHRYIPVLASEAGFKKISEKEVVHQSRKYGYTKFGPERFINGFLDLITIWFLKKFGKRPMHFFGLWGTLMFIIGLAFTTYLGVDKLFFNPQSRLITDRPHFYIALVTMIVGVQFFIAGFIGEVLIRNNNYKINYIISNTTSNYED